MAFVFHSIDKLLFNFAFFYYDIIWQKEETNVHHIKAGKYMNVRWVTPHESENVHSCVSEGDDKQTISSIEPSIKLIGTK